MELEKKRAATALSKAKWTLEDLELNKLELMERLKQIDEKIKLAKAEVEKKAELVGHA